VGVLCATTVQSTNAKEILTHSGDGLTDTAAERIGTKLKTYRNSCTNTMRHEPQPDPDKLYCEDPTHSKDCTCGADPSCYQVFLRVEHHTHVCRGCNVRDYLQYGERDTMNPEHQQFLTDEWQPPDKEIEATTYWGSETGEIALRNQPETGIRSPEIVMLEDMQ